MEKFSSKKGLSVRAYKGDAMTLLCFDLAKDKLADFTGFTIRVTPPGKGQKPFYLYNRMSYNPAVLKKSGIDATQANIYITDNAPLQKYNWVYTPATNHNITDYIYGEYTYDIIPRYLIDDVLQPIDESLAVSVKIDVSPFESGKMKIGFTRGFIESQAFIRHFGNNNKMRPNKTDLLFDITQISGPKTADKKKNPQLVDYTYEDQHKWLGWQARFRIIEFLDEALTDGTTSLDVFAFDLNEPVVCESLLELAKVGRIRVILDNSETHISSTALEPAFEKLFRKADATGNSIVRGCFLALSHSKVFILRRNGKPVKVLTGSTNFSTNGLYVNANHVLVFDHPDVAKAYADVFDSCFGANDTDTAGKMKAFKAGTLQANAFEFNGTKGMPDMSIRFSPHSKTVATDFFGKINKRIKSAQTDVLFAIMKDNSKSSILDAVQEQVQSDKVFTYGITDVIGDKTQIMLYKPNSKRGVRIAGKPGEYILPPPFEQEANIPGISVHHKFVVVDFKGKNPVVYCGSSNLAFDPEQKNGDNLIEITDRDAVTAFAIEAIKLVDHFHWRDVLSQHPVEEGKKVYLHGSKEGKWVNKYYYKRDLRCLEKELFIAEAGK